MSTRSKRRLSLWFWEISTFGGTVVLRLMSCMCGLELIHVLMWTCMCCMQTGSNIMCLQCEPGCDICVNLNVYGTCRCCMMRSNVYMNYVQEYGIKLQGRFCPIFELLVLNKELSFSIGFVTKCTSLTFFIYPWQNMYSTCCLCLYKIIVA